MRVLLDECLPRRLKSQLIGHEVTTVQERGWSGKKNGELIHLMSGTIEVFLTADQNLQYQQYLNTITFSIIVLIERDNRLPTLLPLMSQVQTILETIRPGQLIEVRPPK
jgi:predicted nuclease of predicted toxin-antitoxin system